MKIELDRLLELHPSLDPDQAREVSSCAALAVEREGHAPGVACAVSIDGPSVPAQIAWVARGLSRLGSRQNDRVTEDGAHGVALATLGALGWRVRRALQKGDFADWLLVHHDGSERVFEVSGTRTADVLDRVREKREQVARSAYSAKALCVVGFQEPRVVLENR